MTISLNARLCFRFERDILRGATSIDLFFFYAKLSNIFSDLRQTRISTLLDPGFIIEKKIRFIIFFTQRHKRWIKKIFVSN